MKYPVGQWHVIDDSTGSVAVTEIVDQCEQYHIPLIILESGAAATDFDTSIKASGEFNTWVRRQNYVFVDARSSSWSSNGPKTLREFETRTQFDGNSTSDALPKLLVYSACSTCTESGDLDIDCKKKIAFNSSWTPKQYID